MLLLPENLLFVWEPIDLVMSWHASLLPKKGMENCSKNLLWWVRRF